MKQYSSCFVVFAFVICVNGVFSKFGSEDSYTKHCSSVIPPYNITVRSNGNSLPSLSTSYFTGEDSLLLRMEQGVNRNYVQKNLWLRLRPDYYETTAAGVYEVRGLLYIRFPYDAPARRTSRGSGSLRFPMNGLWSEKSRKLCLIGSAPWRGIDFDAVLKLKFDDENPTIYTGIVSGSLESTASSANDPAFFNPILIFNFLEASNYKYSLLPKEAFPSRKDESLSLDSTEFCSVMEWGLRVLELEYAAECWEEQPRPHRCSPLGNGDGFLPHLLSLVPIHCDKGAKKARFIATFRNQLSFLYNSFPLASTAIGEASWDEKNRRITGVACELLNPSLQLGNVVGDCTITFSLWNPSILTIRNIESRISGEIWISKSAENSGYVRKINLTATNENRAVALLEQRYQYTELDRARNSCIAMSRPSKKGEKYPDGQSYDMRFHFNIKTGNGDVLGRASALPVWVDDDPYLSGSDLVFTSGPVATESEKRRTKMSYEIKIHLRYHLNNISSRRADMAAEGLYDAENGHLCMIGCRKVVARNLTSTYTDCEVMLEFEIPPLSRKRGGTIKGILRSTRPKTDPLHFDDLVMESAAYNRRAAEQSVWRMDMEMAMVLASNALVCIFVALQILHVRKNPEVLGSVSLVMAVMLTVGSIVPFVVNFEAVFLGYHDKKTLQLGNGGRLEANEVAVRIMTMVALLLQLRLLQLVYAAKQSEEKRAGLVSLCLYIFGGLLALLLNSIRKAYGGDRRYSSSVWGDLRTYAGLILDGFLLPQILLNIFKGSAGEVLCRSFYVGTSAVRLVPHAYSQYRAHNYPKYDMDSTYYYYANPAADFYSTAWDIIIPCGIIALAVIVFLQQRRGGRCILPQRFSYVEMSEKVPAADNP